MAQTFDTKINHVALAFKRLLKIKITDSSLQRDLVENPFYPTLLSISNTFDRYNIENAAYHFEAEEFSELQAPFITYIEIPAVLGGDFVLVTEITENDVKFIYDKAKADTLDKETFIKRFKNVVLFAEPDESSGEKEFSSSLKKEHSLAAKTSVWAAGVAGIILVIYAINIPEGEILRFSLLSLLNLTGLAAAILLLTFEINQGNLFVKKLCGLSAKTNCDAVLTSQAAKIWGISWSEIGFFYFSFTTLILFTPGLDFLYKTMVIAIFNIIAVPYIFYSIYYQSRIIRQWCPLCLTVQTVLASELAWSIVYFWSPFHSLTGLFTSVEFKTYLLTTCLALMPILSWYGLKSFFLKAKDHDTYKNAFKRLQNNPEIFNSLLLQQAKAPDGWEDLGINLGNQDAHNNIISVCSTSCTPCAEAHPKLEKLIHENRNVNLKIIFAGSNAHHRDQVARHLLAYTASATPEGIEKIVDEWFSSPKQDFSAFAAKYPIESNLDSQNEKIDDMTAWCRKAEVSHTPTIFVNGYRLHENYDLDELSSFF